MNTTHKYFQMNHRVQRSLRLLSEDISAYVEVGFDAQQIRDELSKQGRVVATAQLDLAISINLGEQQ